MSSIDIEGQVIDIICLFTIDIGEVATDISSCLPLILEGIDISCLFTVDIGEFATDISSCPPLILKGFLRILVFVHY